MLFVFEMNTLIAASAVLVKYMYIVLWYKITGDIYWFMLLLSWYYVHIYIYESQFLMFESHSSINVLNVCHYNTGM